MAEQIGYNKEVLRRFTNPKNFGEIKNADGVGQVGNIVCGDIMKIYFKIKDDKIKDIKFQTFGCVSAIAASDALCEIAKGKTIEEAKKISNKKIIEKLKGLPSIKVHCSVLGAQGLKKAIENYENSQKLDLRGKSSQIENYESKSGKSGTKEGNDEECPSCRLAK